MEFDDWKELMEEGPGSHDEDWMEWTDSTSEGRDLGNTPLIDELDIWSSLKMSVLEIRELLVKPNVSTIDALARMEVDAFVLDCYDRGVSMTQLGKVIGLNVDSSGKNKALTRSFKRAKLASHRQ